MPLDLSRTLDRVQERHPTWDDVKAAGRKAVTLDDLHATLTRLLGAIVRAERFARYGMQVVPDVYPGSSLGGLYTGLQRAQIPVELGVVAAEALVRRAHHVVAEDDMRARARAFVQAFAQQIGDARSQFRVSGRGILHRVQGWRKPTEIMPGARLRVGVHQQFIAFPMRRDNHNRFGPGQLRRQASHMLSRSTTRPAPTTSP